MPQTDLPSIFNVLVDDMINTKQLKPVFKDYVLDILKAKQIHQYQRNIKGKILSVASTLQNFEEYFLGGLDEEEKKKTNAKKVFKIIYQDEKYPASQKPGSFIGI